MALNSLTEIYNTMLEEAKHRREITASTDKMLGKLNPRSSVVRDYETELFGLSEDELKKLPLVAVNTIKKALDHIMGETKKDPQLRAAFKRAITRMFVDAEKKTDKDVKESIENTEEIVTEEMVM